MDPDLGFCPLVTDAAMALLSIATSGSQPPPSSVTTEGEESHHPPASSTRPRTGSTGGGDELRSRPESSSSAAAVRETRELEEEAPRREATAAAGRGGRPPCSGSPHDGESEAGRARGDGHGWSSRGSLGARRARSRPRRPPTGAGMGRRSLGEAPGGAAVTAGIDRGEASAAVTAGMDRGEASATAAIDRGEASATAGIERGEASGMAGIDHGEASAAVTAAIDRGEASATAGIDRGKAPATVTLEPVSDEDEYSQYVLCVIESLKMKVTADRLAYIKKRIEENGSKLSTITRKTCYASKVWQRNIPKDTDLVSNLLTSRLDAVNSLGVLLAEEDVVSYEEQTSNATSTSMLGGLAATNAIGPIKLPKILKHPRYTTWTFVHRNQRMAEDQNDYEAVEDEEEKNGFKGVEDYIIRMTIQECRMTDAVLEILAQCFDRAAGDIKARYEILDGEKTKDSSKGISKLNAKVEDVYRDKDLDAALDSFDNLFCRRCLVFDCRLHGCSQDSVFPTEKQSPWNSMVDDGISCGIHCYKLASKLDATTTIDPHMTIDTEPTRLSENTRKQFASNMKKQGSSGRIAESQQSKNSSTQRVASESNESEVHPTRNKYLQQISPKGKIKKRTNKRIAELINMAVQKERMEVTPSDPTSGGWPRNMKLRSRALNGHNDSVASSQQNYPSTRGSRKKDAPQMEKNVALAEDRNDSAEATDNEHSATYGHDSSRKEESVDGNICRQEDYVRSWKVIEQGLLVKGLEIFGRNSCLIARNLLGGMKTCSDVFQYMNYTENSSASGVLSGVDSLANAYIEGHELRVRSRFFRRRGKVRRLKHTSKSAGYHVIRKRIAEKNGELYQQYNPCGCQSACGKECPCLKNETCCEKYCGCPKMCKNRFRGCHCARSQCRSRQCPCFAADRECDPDVCRNCWVGCGDGSLGFPNQRGDNYECRNMKVLLKQEQRILLGRSDVCGWGAFLKNTVGKDEYIGEYTGELISHTEAGRRGTIYDRVNSSFLFNLNNEFVLDACRMGNKLKFANHSNDPNCYAKVMLVAGDHRVGIFAKERIGAGEEIFYDYNYKPDETPVWALKPDAPGAKDPGQSSCTRAKKPDAPVAKDPGQTPCKRGRKPGH